MHEQKLIELERKIDKSTIILGDFNTPLSVINRTTRQKIIKDTEEFNITINQQDPIYIYRLPHPTTVGCTLFSSAHGTYTKIDYILGYKTNLSRFKRTEVIHSIFSENSEIKLGMNTIVENKWKLNNILLRNLWIKEELSREIQITLTK